MSSKDVKTDGIHDEYETGFSRMPNEFVDNISEYLSVHAIAVYTVLKRYANNSTDRAWPSMETISRKSSIKSRTTIIKALKELAEFNLVVITRKYNPETNRNYSNRYQLPHPKKWGRSPNEQLGDHLMDNTPTGDGQYKDSTNKTNKNNSAGKPRNVKSSEDSEPFTSKRPDPFKENVVFILYGIKRDTNGLYRVGKGDPISKKRGKTVFNHAAKWIREWKEADLDEDDFADYFKVYRSEYPNTEYSKSGNKAALWYISYQGKQSTAPEIKMIEEPIDTGMTEEQRLSLLSEMGVNDGR